MPVVRAIDRLRAGLQGLHRSTVPPSVAVLEMGTGAWTTQTMYVAAKLGVADQLAGGPTRAADLAPRVGADPDALCRLMRALASTGLLRHRRNDTFALTKVGEALRSDVPGSMRDMVLFIGHQARWDWGNLLYSVQTGEPSVLKVRGMPYWDYLETDSELAQVFNDAMTATSGMTNEIALSAYDFSDFRLIVDVGGGHGRLQLDLEMLVTVGGRERTRTDYAKLLSRAGFRLDRVVDTVTPLSIVEASPV